MNNPLLKPSKAPYGTVPFNDIKTEHFVPAITSGIKEAENALQRKSYIREYSASFGVV